MKTLISVVSILFLIFSSTAQAGEICESLLRAKRENDAKVLDMLSEYPGTAAALLGCAAYAANQPKDDQVSAFIGACGITCLVVGFDNCGNLAGRAIDIASTDSEIKRQARANDCYLPN